MFQKHLPDLGSYVPISKGTGTNELLSNPSRNVGTCTAKPAVHTGNLYPKDLRPEV